MTKEEFFNFLIKQGCEAVPKEGVNNTHHFIEFRKKNKYAYLALPINDKVMNEKAIIKIVSSLGIELPPGF